MREIFLVLVVNLGDFEEENVRKSLKVVGKLPD